MARLKDTLERTIGFLEKAQERVLRDIAPILTRTMLEWLPDVTNGRYTGCRIDPESLLVEVRAGRGRWREANRLSHGTVEQVYLLLRFALCRHLTKEGERCPPHPRRYLGRFGQRPKGGRAEDASGARGIDTGYALHARG